MGTTQTKVAHPHAVTELCEEGVRLYANALRAGRIDRTDVEPAPCLMDFALLHPDPDDAQWLRPVLPSIALAQRLSPIEREITERRRLSIELADTFEPFMSLSTQEIARNTTREARLRVDTVLPRTLSDTLPKT